jgi:hypothetical protein
MRNGVDENPFNLLAQNPLALDERGEFYVRIRLTLQEHSCGSFFVKYRNGRDAPTLEND